MHGIFARIGGRAHTGPPNPPGTRLELTDEEAAALPRLVNRAIQDGRYPLLLPIPADLSRCLGRLCPRDGDRLVAFRRAHNRLEHRNTV